MTRLKGILFDYGHTLVYFPRIGKTHIIATKKVQEKLGYLGIAASTSKIRNAVLCTAYREDDIVMSMEDQFAEALRMLGVHKWSAENLDEIMNAYWEPYIRNVRVRKGAKNVLGYLKEAGLRLGIVANVWSNGMNPVLERLELQHFFDTIITSVDVGFSKPHPRIFNLALDCLQLRPEETIMVGDNPETDILGAYNVGMVTVRLIRGPSRNVPDLVIPVFRIRNLLSLRSIIRAYRPCSPH